MMNKLLLLIASACLLTCCAPSRHINFKLKADEFSELQVKDTIHRSYPRDMDAIFVRLPQDGYERITKRKGQSIIFHWVFYPSGRLKSTRSTTNGFDFGNTYLYDEAGNRISITDNDAPFKITVTKLDAKFALGYGLNVFAESTTIVRSKDDNDNPVYRVTFPVNSPEGYKARRFIIDGLTGKVISDAIVALGQKEKI